MLQRMHCIRNYKSGNTIAMQKFRQTTRQTENIDKIGLIPKSSIMRKPNSSYSMLTKKKKRNIQYKLDIQIICLKRPSNYTKSSCASL